MKLTFTCFFALLLSGAVFSQSIEMIDPVSVAEGSLSNPEDAEMKVEWNVTNSSDTEITVRLKRVINYEIVGTENYFCWGPQCYGSSDDESSSLEFFLVTIPAGAVDTTFKGYYEHQGRDGCTSIDYCWFDHYDDSDISCSEVIWAVDCTVNVEENATSPTELGDLSPNPVKGLSTLSYSTAGEEGNISISIYSINGQLVKEIPLMPGAGMIFIDGSEFEPGLYIYTLNSDSGVLESKKMLVAE